MKPAVLHFVGHSNTGKTAFIEGCLRELGRRGLKTACVKHCHKGVDAGPPGKDSEGFQAAGCRKVLLVAPDRTVFVENHRPDVAELVRTRFAGEDVVLVEGFKFRDLGHKVLFLRKGVAEDWIVPEEELTAVVSDFPVQCGIPRFGAEEIREFIDFMEAKMEKQRSMRVSVQVNGKDVSTNEFVDALVGNVIQAMVASLKLEDRDVRSIKIELAEKG